MRLLRAPYQGHDTNTIARPANVSSVADSCGKMAGCARTRSSATRAGG